MARPLDLLCIGIDPGASASVSLIRRRRGLQPLYVGGWSIWGGSDAAWWRRYDEAAAGLRAALDERPGLPITAALEVPGGRGASRKKLGPDTWLGMGRRAGRLEGLVRAVGAPLHDLGSDRWPRLAQVPVGKRGTGAHRLQEAAQALEGFGAALARIPSGSDSAHERLVCLAESALIAFAHACATPWDAP